jgi:integrase
VTLEGDHRLVTEPKAEAGRRVVALPQLVVDALTEHLGNQDPGREGPQALLFPAEDGGLLPVTTFYKHWRRAPHQVGRYDLNCTTFATWPARWRPGRAPPSGS